MLAPTREGKLKCYKCKLWLDLQHFSKCFHNRPDYKSGRQCKLCRRKQLREKKTPLKCAECGKERFLAGTPVDREQLWLCKACRETFREVLATGGAHPRWYFHEFVRAKWLEMGPADRLAYIRRSYKLLHGVERCQGCNTDKLPCRVDFDNKARPCGKFCRKCRKNRDQYTGAPEIHFPGPFHFDGLDYRIALQEKIELKKKNQKKR